MAAILRLKVRGFISPSFNLFPQMGHPVLTESGVDLPQMQVWVIALSPATELTDLKAVAVLVALLPVRLHWLMNRLISRASPQTAAPAWAASKSRETYASASALSMPSKTGRELFG